MEKLTIYEAHVHDFTAKCQYVEPEHRGKFFGICHPYVIDHLKTLGVNVLQLMPIFDSKGTHWGYDPISWFELNPKYGTLNEFKIMVGILKANGIKVVLDVVYNHTAEKLKFVQYGNTSFSGCGNDVLVDKSMGIIRESIDHWLSIVDGIRFDLAPVMFRENGEFKPNGMFSRYIKQHADNGKLIICEPWDLHGYFVGQFPDFCLEHNDKIRDAVRQGGTYYCGDKYEKYIGFATCHDGYTMHDLVSYNYKHNECNGEDNRDGCNCNYSNNHGVEGETDNQWIISAREDTKRRMRENLRTSAYHVMLLMGDEFNRTQGGCNNGYLHSTPVVWY